MNSNPEQEPRYSLKTLTALHDGSIHGRVTGRGDLRLTITDEDHQTFTGRVLSVNGTHLAVEIDNGPVRKDIKPAWVQHAEVV